MKHELSIKFNFQILIRTSDKKMAHWMYKVSCLILTDKCCVTKYSLHWIYRYVDDDQLSSSPSPFYKLSYSSINSLQKTFKLCFCLKRSRQKIWYSTFQHFFCLSNRILNTNRNYIYIAGDKITFKSIFICILVSMKQEKVH